MCLAVRLEVYGTFSPEPELQQESELSGLLYVPPTMDKRLVR